MNVKPRCEWCQGDPLMIKYHDEEWGVPFTEDNVQFEHMLMEIFQAGLSWSIVLNKRENFRNAFANFDIAKVAEFTIKDEKRLLADSGIIRNKMKIQAAINNSGNFISLAREHNGFYRFLWQYKPSTSPVYKKMTEIPAQTPESKQLSKDLKKLGFKFVGPTTCYAHMQAVGVVNDHEDSCFRYAEIEKLRSIVLKEL